MAFGDSAVRTAVQSTDNANSPYLKLAGEVTVRVLDTEETAYWRYWMPVNVAGNKQARSIVVGRDGPIARHFASIGKGNQGYVSVQQRRLLNVFDRTLVKRTVNGSYYPDADGIYPTTDAAGLPLAGVQPTPANRVGVIDIGSDLITDLRTLHNRVKHAQTYTALPIWQFDVVIVTTKTGPAAKDVSRRVLSGTDQTPIQELVAQHNLVKYDLRDFTRIMPDEAQQRILAGDDFVEIMKELGWDRPTPKLPVAV